VAAGGRPALIDAIILEDVEMARRICDGDPSIDVSGDSQYIHDDTFLMVAATFGSLPLVRFLVDRGADIEGTIDLGTTALLRAASRGHLEVVRFLLEHGADVNRGDWSYNTPLSNAATNGYSQIVDLLVAHGAQPNLLSAIALNTTHVVARLLAEGADPNQF